MKKVLLSVLALAAILPTWADSCFVMGNGDSIRIHPSHLGCPFSVDMSALFDGYVDHWHIEIVYPTGLTPIGVSPSTGMSIPFINHDGVDSVFTAQLSVINNGTAISSTITKLGYWDENNDGVFEPYGTIKWGASPCDSMFVIHMLVDEVFRSGVMYIYGYLSSTCDLRGFSIPNTMFQKTVLFYVGFLRGDVDGNDVISIADVTLLTDYILNQIEFDEFQLTAADVDGDGMVGISDVTELTDML